MAVETKPRTARRTLMIIGAVALVLLVAFFFWRRRGSAEPRFDTAVVQRGRLIARVTATGTLSALVTVQVGSQVSGRIAQLNVDFNSPVKKGDLIAKIDPQLFDAAVEQARANFIEAKGNLSKSKAQAVDAQRQLNRSKTLLERQLISQADYDTTETNKLAADAQVDVSAGAVEVAKAALHQAQVNLAYTSIISPIDGTVISRNVDVGQTVAASLQAPTLFTIAENLKKMQVDTNVAEADVGRLEPGMIATFTVDAYPNERFQGRIRQIRNAPQTVQNVVTYDAVIDVDNSALKLKPGMTTNVTVVVAEKDDVLKVSNSALRFKPGPELLQMQMRSAGMQGGKEGAAGGQRVAGRAPGEARRFGGGRPVDGSAEVGTPPPANEKTVWVLRDNRPVPVSVKTGISDGTLSEVMAGPLNEGDQVITAMAGGGGDQPRGPGGPRGPRLF
jgi:HlyD family secretion protein